MDSIWSNVIKATGAVGVVAFLIYIVVNQIFSEQVVALFGSDRLFVLTIVIIASLLIILLVAIFKSKEKQVSSSQSEGPKVTYNGKSTHNGDNNF